MSIIDLFVDRRPSIANITLDATISEEHGRSAELSNYPVEDGADRSDHRRVNPKTLTITGLVSAVQWNLNYAFRDFWAASQSLDVSRHRTAWKLLNALFEKDEEVIVATDLQTYRKMMFVSLVATVQAKTTEVLRFSATFREVKLAYTTFVAAAAAEVADLAAEAAEAGGKQTQAASAAETAAALDAIASLGI